MSEFNSWRSYWDFSSAVKWRSRYIHDEEVQQFLSVVLATSEKRRATIPKGTILWRAQCGYVPREVCSEDGEVIGDEEWPFPPKRMKPEPGRASEGRANPKGIPYLYLSDDRDTALAEVRPWIGLRISVAQFRILKDLLVIDCSQDSDRRVIYFKEPEPDKREQAVWGDINAAFSQPITPTDKVADYVPTQIIAELFKSSGHDGIVYKSGCGAGHNVALFDLEIAQLLNCSLYTPVSLKFDFEECANPYFVKEESDC
ncbi:MAG: RES family NAD+ phosphorylase [Promethearchaeota archaeon]